MSDYPLISDHGLIGDLQTSALVTKDGTIDFFCAPRFDSPSIFASLLDARNGGSFRIASRLDDDYTTTQMYFPQSACLITRFMTDAGGRRANRLHAHRQPHDHHRQPQDRPGCPMLTRARCRSAWSANPASTSPARR